ncbi:rCG21883 [Rattus norvegicus]|uniref:RCG21883 n=1 Tax=Rattus norvegicus TaxID=10116 RepID=A6J054_RAT|nr:rCG21883 [Rattus norvegicus]
MGSLLINTLYSSRHVHIAMSWPS